MRRLHLVLVFILVMLGLEAQDIPKVSLDLDAVSFLELRKEILEQTQYSLYYRSEWVDSLQVTIHVDDQKLDVVLEQIISGTSLDFLIMNDQIFITNDIKVLTSPKLAELLIQDKTKIQTNVEKGLVFKREYQLTGTNSDQLSNQIFEIGSRSELVSGGKATIAGYLKDAVTGEPLPSALVYSERPLLSTLTDASGFYSFTLPLGKNKIRYQLVGMKPSERNVILFSNGQLNVNMYEDVFALDEVVIQSDRDANIESVQMGVSKISISESKNVPIVLGERDIMKVATTLAGIQTVGEGASGFNVRGGKADQNLILLDKFPLYNTSHFFGFFSVFNSEAVEDMQVYKSSMPARYGGRLSSVMDIKSKQARRDTIGGSGGISPITSKLTFELPLFSGKAGLMLGGRATYTNWMLDRIGNSEFAENDVSFADAVLRYDHDINENNKLTVSGYWSVDNFKIDSDTLFAFSDFNYSNRALSVDYTNAVSRDLSLSFTGVYSGYGYNLKYDASPEGAFVQDFDISEVIGRGELIYTGKEKHEMRGGVEVKKLSVNPGSQLPLDEESLVERFQIERENGLESSIYISDQYNFNDRLSFYSGLRYSTFASIGEQTVYDYLDDAPKNEETISDSIRYGKGELIKLYGGIEPRISARYKLNRRSSIKLGYNRTRQYSHTLTNSASISPTDIWRLSSTHLKPQIADQISLGYYQNFTKQSIETSLEGYYKRIDNLLDFKVGSKFLLNPTVEAVALQGPGKSYGLELSIKKEGKLSGWINYTFARTFIKLDSRFGEERINGGVFYPANYDIPHTVNLVSNYKFTHRLSFSYNFVFKSGRPITYPVGVYDFYRSLSIHYSDRNAYRIPYYMRMDFGINLEAGHKRNKLAYSYWSFSIYNFLGRKNPYSVFFSTEGNQIKGYKLVVFGNPIPTISYNFKF